MGWMFQKVPELVQIPPADTPECQSCMQRRQIPCLIIFPGHHQMRSDLRECSNQNRQVYPCRPGKWFPRLVNQFPAPVNKYHRKLRWSVNQFHPPVNKCHRKLQRMFYLQRRSEVSQRFTQIPRQLEPQYHDHQLIKQREIKIVQPQQRVRQPHQFLQRDLAYVGHYPPKECVRKKKSCCYKVDEGKTKPRKPCSTHFNERRR